MSFLVLCMTDMLFGDLIGFSLCVMPWHARDGLLTE